MAIMTAPDEDKPRRGRPPGARTERQAPHRGRHRDLTLAIKAVRDAGVENFRVTVDRMGTISVVPLAPALPAKPEGANEWDEVLKKDEDSKE